MPRTSLFPWQFFSYLSPQATERTVHLMSRAVEKAARLLFSALRFRIHLEHSSLAELVEGSNNLPGEPGLLSSLSWYCSPSQVVKEYQSYRFNLVPRNKMSAFDWTSSSTPSLS